MYFNLVCRDRDYGKFSLLAADIKPLTGGSLTSWIATGSVVFAKFLEYGCFSLGLSAEVILKYHSGLNAQLKAIFSAIDESFSIS